MLEFETIGGVVAGGAAVLLYQRLRKSYPGMPPPDAPLRAVGSAAGKVAESTSRLGTRAAHGIEDAGQWVAHASPARAVGGAVAGAVGTSTRVASSATSRIVATVHPDLADQVIASATRFHRPECRYASSGSPVERAVAVANGLEPCSLCEP